MAMVVAITVAYKAVQNGFVMLMGLRKLTCWVILFITVLKLVLVD